MGRILLVEDDADVRSVCAVMLTRVGHDVIEQTHARDAIEFLEGAGKLDLAVLDVILHDGSAREVAIVMARLQPDVPILLIPALDVTSLQALGYLDDNLIRQGNVHCLQKPFTFQELAGIVTLLLGRVPARDGAIG